MNTKVSITLNGNVAPNKVIDLGYKYENVGDTIQFVIPQEYMGFYSYLAFSMKKMETILLPVNLNEEGILTFYVTTTITKNPGTYQIIFLCTENVIENGDIDGARKVFVSNTMTGTVKDNFLVDPVAKEEQDENVKIFYDRLNLLAETLENNLKNDYYRGAYYIPKVDSVGYISWSRSDGKDIDIPASQNITGPTGKSGGGWIPHITDDKLGFNYFNVDSYILQDKWKENAVYFVKDLSTAGDEIYVPVGELDEADFEPNKYYVKYSNNPETIATPEYDLKTPMIEKVEEYVGEVLPDQVSDTFSKKFQWRFDEETKELYIYAENSTFDPTIGAGLAVDLREKYEALAKKCEELEKKIGNYKVNTINEDGKIVLNNASND